MTGNNCPYCGKKCPNKLSAKKHKKVCKFIPVEAEKETVVDIKAEETELVKLINPYRESFPNLFSEDDPSHDVTIVSSCGSLVTCHAAVLAASSPYWADLLEDACKEDDNVLVVAQNVNVDQIKNLVGFLYRGEIRASREEVNDIKILLEEFQMLFNIDVINIKEDVQGVETVENINDYSEEITEDVDMIKDEFSGDDDEDYEPGDEDYEPIKMTGTQKKRGRPKKEDILKRKRALRAKRLKKEESKRVCDYCELISKNLKDTMKHVQETHPDVFGDFSEKYIQTPCQFCDKKFLNKELLYLHKRESHPLCLPTGRRLHYNINDGLPYKAQRQCPHCPKILLTIERYTDHVESHISGSDQPFACEHCEKKFSRSERLRAHSKKHEISKTPLLCNLCGTTYQTEFDYDEHNKIHIKEAKMESPMEKKRKKPKPIDPNFSAVCSICGKKFTKQSSFKYHTINAHVEEDKLRKCPHCPQTFTIFSAWDCHIKLHLPPTLQCKHCPKKFPTPQYLTRHIRSQHMADNLKDFVCNQCGKGFNIKDSYIGHLNMHAGLKPYKCRYCEMCYQNTSNRIAHEKSRHPDLYVRRSELCGRSDLAGVPIKKRQPIITPNT